MELTTTIKRSLKRFHWEIDTRPQDIVKSLVKCQCCPNYYNTWNPYWSENYICAECELFNLVDTEMKADAVREKQSKQAG